MGDFSSWDMQLGDLSELQQNGHSLALPEPLPPHGLHSQQHPQDSHPKAELDPHSGDSQPTRGLPSVPASVFESGGAFPEPPAQRSLSPDSGGPHQRSHVMPFPTASSATKWPWAAPRTSLGHSFRCTCHCRPLSISACASCQLYNRLEAVGYHGARSDCTSLT